MEVKIMFESNNTPFTMPVMPANSGYGNNGAWGDDGAWWIIIFVLFFFCLLQDFSHPVGCRTQINFIRYRESGWKS